MDQNSSFYSSSIDSTPSLLADDFLEGLSAGMRALEVVIRELSKNRVPVLILAEAGAGKRSVARRIHELSGVPLEQFRSFSCASLMPEEIESEGEFGQGTVFLEEVGDLSSACQAKLAQALSETPQNGNHPLGARLICDSAHDLESEMRLGKFREDLYYRISAVCLRLPPLRQRKEDIPFLVNFFLAKYAQEFRRPVPALSPQTQQLLEEYTWPGNIRELSDAARAIVILGNEALAMDGLRAVLTKTDQSRPGSQSPSRERISLKQASRAASREAEKELILNALTRTRWNRRRAAQDLQISYKALLYKLKQIGFGGEAEAS
jgi:two-component system response regulator AtoC